MKPELLNPSNFPHIIPPSTTKALSMKAPPEAPEIEECMSKPKNGRELTEYSVNNSNTPIQNSVYYFWLFSWELSGNMFRFLVDGWSPP